MKTLLLIAALATIPHDAATVREYVDCIERNHFHDDAGRQVFTQIIFYDWVQNHHEVVAWRMEKDGFRFHPPVATWTEDDWVRQVRGAYWRESWTQYDPETAAREWLPSDKRRGLRR